MTELWMGWIFTIMPIYYWHGKDNKPELQTHKGKKKKSTFVFTYSFLKPLPRIWTNIIVQDVFVCCKLECRLHPHPRAPHLTSVPDQCSYSWMNTNAHRHVAKSRWKPSWKWGGYNKSKDRLFLWGYVQKPYTGVLVRSPWTFGTIVYCKLQYAAYFW